MKLNEFYLERQGHPDSKVSLDMDSRRPVIPRGLIVPGMLADSVYDEFVEYDLVDDEPVEGAVTIPISSNWAYEHEQEQEEKLYHYGKIIKMLLRILWDDIDWENVDLDEVDWDEWE